MNNKKNILIILFVISLITLGGILSLRNKNKKDIGTTTYNNENLNFKKETKINETEIIKSGNMKVYTDKNYNYKIIIPQDFVLNEIKTKKHCLENPDICYPINEYESRTLISINNHSIDGYISKDDLSISVGVFKSDKDVINWFKDYINNKTDQERIDDAINNTGFKKGDIVYKSEYGKKNNYDFVIDFFSSKKVASEGNPITNKHFYLKNGDYIYDISASFITNDTDKFLPEVDKILNSFEFINNTF